MTTLVVKNESYELDAMSQEELAELLYSIEEIRKTGFIDQNSILQFIDKRHQEKKRQAILDMVANSGFSQEDFIEVLNKDNKPKLDSNISSPKKNGKGLYVITKNGTLIQDAKDNMTFYKAIVEAGAKDVYNLHIRRLGTELISKTKNGKYTNRMFPITIESEEYYLIINFSNIDKMHILQSINKALCLGWTIGINNEN